MFQSKKQIYLDKMTKLQQAKMNLENHEFSKPVLKKWFEYKAMSENQKRLLLEDWNKYFEDVKKTKACRRYQIISDRIKKHMPIGEYVEKAREQLENQDWELPKPYLDDPMYLMSNQYVSMYEKVLADIENLKMESDIENVVGSMI